MFLNGKQCCTTTKRRISRTHLFGFQLLREQANAQDDARGSCHDDERERKVEVLARTPDVVGELQDEQDVAEVVEQRDPRLRRNEHRDGAHAATERFLNC